MDTSIPNDGKTEAYHFLEEFGKSILKTAPPAADMEASIRQIVAAARVDETKKHLRLPEAAFLNTYVLPVLHERLQTGEWTSPEHNFGLTQSCPDFALKSPFPHSMVFEGKYFARGSRDYVARQLVSDIYQAFFYRGLPRVDATKRGHPEWDYDYACLLAYDASPDGTLVAAWEALDSSVRQSFWDGANIYVMILRG